jgi:hypothetical protein
MKANELEKACRKYEAEHGIEAFLDAMAVIMQKRMARHGVALNFYDEAGHDIRDGNHRSAQPSTYAP